jgi:hypothetical protein
MVGAPLARRRLRIRRRIARVATVLLRASERELRSLGFDHAVLWVLDQNTRARRFYEREGWMADGGVKTETVTGTIFRAAGVGRETVILRSLPISVGTRDQAIGHTLLSLPS